MIMSTISSAPAALEARVGQSWAGRLGTALKRWCVAYIMWRIEQVAPTQLYAVSDRHLKDIWLTRSAIAGAVRNEAGVGAYGGAAPESPDQALAAT
jgi:hypothetical protein